MSKLHTLLSHAINARSILSGVGIETTNVTITKIVTEDDDDIKRLRFGTNKLSN